MSFANPKAVRMLALAFLAQNLALGLSYGTYGAFVLHFVEEFDAPLSLAGSGLAITAHMIPLGRGMGFEPGAAAMLLSVYGFAAASGAFLFGWLADRSSGVGALLVNALLHAVSWSLMLFSSSYGLALLAAALMGLGGGGLTVAISARLGEQYSPRMFGQALGLALAMNMPFTFGTAPLMGWLHDLSGNYHLAFVFLVALYIAAAAVFARFLLRARHPAQQQG